MLHPSYTELMERINKDVEEGDTPIVQSRYSIVKATADRAKQIIASRSISDRVEKDINANPNMKKEAIMTKEQILTQMRGEPLIADTDEMKPLSIAVEELYCGAVKIAERAESDNLHHLESKETADEDESEKEDEASSDEKNADEDIDSDTDVEEDTDSDSDPKTDKEE